MGLLSAADWLPFDVCVQSDEGTCHPEQQCGSLMWFSIKVYGTQLRNKIKQSSTTHALRFYCSFNVGSSLFMRFVEKSFYSIIISGWKVKVSETSSHSISTVFSTFQWLYFNLKQVLTTH